MTMNRSIFLAHRKHQKDCQFLVSCKDYRSHENTWEPTHQFIAEDVCVHKSPIKYANDDNILEILQNSPSLDLS